jgi:uncharacterized membrane protein (UPF0127 family)
MKQLLLVLAFACACAASAQIVGEPSSALLSGMPRGHVWIETAGGTHTFQVWIADNDRRRQQGLMFIKDLPADHGMLFLFDRPQPVSFWMKNTYISLDIVFITSEGLVANIAHRTQPLSLTPIESVAPVTAVLEIAAGTAARIGLAPGDRVRNSALPTP